MDIRKYIEQVFSNNFRVQIVNILVLAINFLLSNFLSNFYYRIFLQNSYKKWYKTGFDCNYTEIIGVTIVFPGWMDL